MLKNQKDAGAPLEALGTWRVRCDCSRLELELLGWEHLRGLGRGEEERRVEPRETPGCSLLVSLSG